ncbi:hypothetical protein IKF30_02915 [Candidatus Saccharibacteria bacterium]|nr:hypothetical protein [Candidatus Saccharibacteria bacterium]
MSKLISLLKATMSGGLQLFNYQAKTESAKRTMPLLLGSLIGILMLFSATAMMTDLAKEGAQSAILAIYVLITTIIIVMEGSYKAGDLLFKPKDNDVLLSMPIKRSTIVLARMIRFYVFEMVYCLIFLLPAIIAYAMNAELEASFFIVAVMMLLLVPVIPIAVSCIIGLIISVISGRFKHRTFWQIVLSLVVMFASVGLVFTINATSDYDGHNMIALSDRITKYYYPASAFVKLVTHFNIVEYLLFVMINLGVLVLTVLVISRFCFQIITKLGTFNRIEEKTNIRYTFRRHNQTVAMIQKELTRYFNTPVLLVNTAMGLVFFVIAVAALCFKFDDLASSLVSSSEDFPLTVDEIRSFLPGVTFAMVAFASLLTCITATMVSLEGKAFNVLKALPISGQKVLMAKVWAAVLLIVPVTALGCLVMGLRFQFGILDAILILIGVVAMPMVTELIGILINLKYPRFDADNDTVVVRQSASVMVATFLGLGMVLLTVSLTFGVIFLAGQTAGLAIMDAIYVTVALFLYLAVVTWGGERYTKLAV